MDAVHAISTALGASWASGVNLYCTVAVLGALSHCGVQLPGKLAVVGDWRIIAVASVLYAIEFVADKVPWFDSVWDSVHTFIRPPVAAALAALSVTDQGQTAEAIVALVGAAAAASSHGAKATTRLVANASPEPFSNWLLSVVEDLIALMTATLAAVAPLAAGVVAAVGIVASIVVLFAVGQAALKALRKRRSTRAG